MTFTLTWLLIRFIRKFDMLQFLKDLAKAAVLATLFGGPLFAYFLFVMQP